MRIVSWNCNGAFRKKAQYLVALEADLYVICESENKQRLGDPEALREYPHRCWIGDNPNKGLLVAARAGISLQKVSWHNASRKLILPLHITGGCNLLLFAVWTRNVTHPRSSRYIGQLKAAFTEYVSGPYRQDESILIVGDFNSNKNFDREYPRDDGHSAVVGLLEKHRLRSLYHHKFGEAFGSETHYTHAHRHNFVDQKRRFHIDYCFMTEDLLDSSRLVIPPLESVKGWSDHVPLIVDV